MGESLGNTLQAALGTWKKFWYFRMKEWLINKAESKGYPSLKTHNKLYFYI